MSTSDALYPARQNNRPGVNQIPHGRRLVWYGNRRRGAVLPYPRRFGGLIPILLMLVLAYPIAFYATGRWRVCVFLALTLPATLRNGGRAFW